MKTIFIISLFIGIFNYSYSQTEALQAMFMYNFTKYFEWPTSYQSGDFVIGVLGDSPIIASLNAIAQTKKAGNQTIVIKKFSSATLIEKCNILYIVKDKSDALNEAKMKTNGNTLIVTDKDGLGTKGANINFVLKFDQYFLRHKLHQNMTQITPNLCRIIVYIRICSFIKLYFNKSRIKP